MAVAPFEARERLPQADADAVTEVYSLRLSGEKVRAITRDSLDKAIREQGFREGDWSDDAKAAALGEALNADWIVRGTVQNPGDTIIITITILNVKNLQVINGRPLRVASMNEVSERMDGLIVWTVHTLREGGRKAPDGEYRVGDFGPAGGWIFYDKGKVTDGWRYLEAAPVEAEFWAEWGVFGISIGGTKSDIGTGRRNTELIVEFLRRTGESGRAAQLCDELVFGGHDDWFLPSDKELEKIRYSIVSDLGEFSDTNYWSSSESDSTSARTYDFGYTDDEAWDITDKNVTYNVRAVRAF
ncbi:MAG: DUF1566 domain-containing protein [Treponema sp.]|nr:DUF1566 domain-containing protein [Treponema sp.]